jgi:leader peptidase (prepilin peptidase)/N-methyltransferase
MTTGTAPVPPDTGGRFDRVAAALPSAWLRAVITRNSVPAGQPLRRACPHCAAPLAWSVYLPTGRCRQCAGRAGPAPYTVELALLATAALLVAGPRGVLELPAYTWFAVLGVTLSFVDAMVRRLPNLVTLLWAGGVLAGLALPAVAADRGDDWLRAVLGAIALTGSFGVLAAVRPGSLGWGDVKAGLAVGAALGWLSWVALYAGIFLAFLLAVLYAVVLVLRRRAGRGTRVVFGPFLFAGAIIVAALLP